MCENVNSGRSQVMRYEFLEFTDLFISWKKFTELGVGKEEGTGAEAGRGGDRKGLCGEERCTVWVGGTEVRSGAAECGETGGEPILHHLQVTWIE